MLDGRTFRFTFKPLSFRFASRTKDFSLDWLPLHRNRRPSESTRSLALAFSQPAIKRSRNDYLVLLPHGVATTALRKFYFHRKRSFMSRHCVSRLKSITVAFLLR